MLIPPFLIYMAAKLLDPIAAAGYIGAGFAPSWKVAAGLGAAWGFALELLTVAMFHHAGRQFMPMHLWAGVASYALAAVAVFWIRRAIKRSAASAGAS